MNKTADSYEILSLTEEALHQKRHKMFKDLKNFMKDHLKVEYGRASIIKYIIEPTKRPFKICHLKGLLKLHKPGDKMRIIYPLAGHPLSNLHKFLAKCLEPAVIKKESVITNVMEIIDWITNNELPAGTTFCTADISAMYPNVDRDSAIQIAIEELESMSPPFTYFANSIFWRRLLHDAHVDIEFKFQNQLFKQTKGVPIGSPAGPQLAMIYLHKKIEEKWSILKEKMSYGGIYFDDTFMIFKPGFSPSTIKEMLNHLLEDTSLKFDEESFVFKTVEELLNDTFDILDISIMSERVDDKFKCFTKMFSKPIGSSQYLHYCSAHPPAIKRAIIKGELSRRLRLTDKKNDWIKTKKQLWEKLRQRKYPPSVLKKEFKKVLFRDQQISRNTVINNIKSRRANIQFPINCNITHPNPEPTIPLITRYDPSVLRNAKRRRTEIEGEINNLLASQRFKIRKVTLINSFKVTNKLEKLFNKKTQPVDNPDSQTIGSSSSSTSRLEIDPIARTGENSTDENLTSVT